MYIYIYYDTLLYKYKWYGVNWYPKADRTWDFQTYSNSNFSDGCSSKKNSLTPPHIPIVSSRLVSWVIDLFSSPIRMKRISICRASLNPENNRVSYAQRLQTTSYCDLGALIGLQGATNCGCGNAPFLIRAYTCKIRWAHFSALGSFACP